MADFAKWGGAALALAILACSSPSVTRDGSNDSGTRDSGSSDGKLDGGVDPMNPTGQPVGGGAGYTAAPQASAATATACSFSELAVALAAAKSGDTVWVDGNCVIDADGGRITVPEGVTLASDRGQAGAQGALFKTKYTATNAIFVALEPNSRLTGMRIEGSNPLTKDVDAQPSDDAGTAVACDDAEVDNVEIYKFRREGIAFYRNCDKCYAHHNYIHDVSAYPFFVARGTGDAHIVEANKVNWAWHAVGSNGSPGSGYTARYNVFERVTRPKLFDAAGPDPPNWCLDVHQHDGTDDEGRPQTRLLIVHNNVFTAHPAVMVGDGSELIITPDNLGLYPKYDIYIGRGDDMHTMANVYGNQFLMNQVTGSNYEPKPYGRAIRVEGLKGNAAVADDPLTLDSGTLDITIQNNQYGSN